MNYTDLITFADVRRDALTVQCPYCPANQGEPCVSPDGRGGIEPLTNLPAHNSRIRAAQAVVQ